MPMNHNVTGPVKSVTGGTEPPGDGVTTGVGVAVDGAIVDGPGVGIGASSASPDDTTPIPGKADARCLMAPRMWSGLPEGDPVRDFSLTQGEHVHLRVPAQAACRNADTRSDAIRF